MTRGPWRTTVWAAGGGALLFALLGLYMNTAIGDPFLSNPGPVAMLAVIGGTVGGLVAPLFTRSSGGEAAGTPDSAGGSGTGPRSPDEPGGG